MKRNFLTNFLTTLFVFGAFAVSASFVTAQEATPSPNPSPTPVQISNNKRTSGVKINKTPQTKSDTNTSSTVNQTVDTQVEVRVDPTRVNTIDPPIVEVKSKVEDREEQNRRELEKKRAEEDRIAAGQAALEREKKKAAEEAEAKMREEMLRMEKEAQERLDAEKKRQAEELETLRLQAEEEKRQLAAKAEAERVEQLRRFEEANRKTEEEKLQKEQELAALQKKAEQERLEKEKAEQEALLAKQEADKKEQERLEAERIANEKIEAEKLEKAKFRTGLIEMAAKKFKFINIAEAVKLVPETAVTIEEIEAVLKTAIAQNLRLTTPPSFCDGDYEGEPLNVMLSANPTLGGLLNELSSLYNINFLPDSEVLELPVAGDVKDVPWNYVLRTQLNYLDLEARCAGGNTIAIMKRSKLQTMTENLRKTAPIKTEFIKLKYLQPVVGGQVNVAGRASGGANALESLEAAINKILRADGDNRGSISRIPGKNEFIITATDDQLAQIKQVIARADRPSYQVVIYASIVTANENKLKDVGGQVSAIGGTANLNLLGGLTGFGGTSQNGGSSQNSGTTNGGSSNPVNTPGSLNPGGVRTLGQGFGTAPTGGSTFGISNIFGTVQLSAQLNLLAQQGVVKIDNRPSIIVIDGQTADLQIGRQVAIPIQSIGTLGGGTNELQILNAGNTLNATPQVIEDENGNPVAVNLNLRVESNDVDTTVVSQGVPSIIRRSTQTSLMLNTSQTAVIGGFSTDSETNSESKTPGLGDVPVFGGLFKRKVKAKNSDRLYFAIRVEVVSQGQILTTVPINIDTTPRLPNLNNDFFQPYNQPVNPQTPNN